jgi:hypothetical protein
VNFKDSIVGLGIAVAVAGIAIVVDPGLAGLVPSSRLFVIVAGVFILFQGVRVTRARRRTEFPEAETPDFEASLRVPTPGEEHDESLERTQVASFKDTRGQTSAQDDAYQLLRSVAIETITQRRGCSEEEAIEILEAGTWTDDPHAAAFFGADRDRGMVSVLDALRRVGQAETKFQREFRHAAYALQRLAEGEGEGARE